MSFVRKLPLVAMLAAAPALASAMNYNYVEAGFGDFDAVKGSNDGSALYLGGAFGLNNQVGLQGSVGFLDFDNNVNGNSLSAGLFFHTPMNGMKKLDFVGSVNLLYYTWDAPVGFDDNTSGFTATGGLRYEVQDNFQVEGKLQLTEISNSAFDDGLGLSVDGRYYIDRQFSVAAGLASSTEYDGLFVNLRYDLK